MAYRTSIHWHAVIIKTGKICVGAPMVKIKDITLRIKKITLGENIWGGGYVPFVPVYIARP